MLTIQTIRKKLLFGFVLALLAPGVSEAAQCADLFAVTGLAVTRPKMTAAEELSRVAEFESPEAYAKALVAEGRTRSSIAETQVYEALIAPGLWSFARLKVLSEAIPAQPESRATDWIGKIQRDALEKVQRNQRDSDRGERPKVMTADERMWVLRTGNYDMVDRPYRARTAAEQRQAAFREMLAQVEAQMRPDRVKNEDPVRAAFEGVMRSAGGQEFLAKTHIDRLLESPVDFAIIYAQVNGLIYSAGEAGMKLTPHVPWVQRVDKASANSLRAVAAMARAMALENPERLRASEVLILEILRHEFAPHLDLKFEF